MNFDLAQFTGLMADFHAQTQQYAAELQKNLSALLHANFGF